MAENSVHVSNASDNMKCKFKITGVSAKRPALSVVNGNVNPPKCNNNSKFNCKSQNQPAQSKKSRAVNVQKFKIYKDRNEVEKSVADKENNFALASESLTDEFPSSVECFELPSTSKEEKHKVQDNKNLLWDTPYKEDIYSYFKNIERNFRPNANYMAKQSDITMKMRSVLVDWLVEVGEEYKLQVETLYLAVSYVDRFLSHMSVFREKLQLVGTASMFIAAKYEEIYPPELKDFVYITDDTYTKKQILRMEHLILKVLNFDISVPTTYSFLQLYCCMCSASETIINLSQYICELSLLDSDPFLKFSPSLLAAGSLALANYTLGLDMWNETLIALSGYQLKELNHVILCLYNKYSSMASCPQQAIREKYKAIKYSCVAAIQHPKQLIFPEKSKQL